MPAIEVSDLRVSTRPHFWRPQTWLLRGLTLSVPEGGVCAIVGPNGAGKTTLIKVLLGLLRPHSGSATIFGAAAGSSKARRRIGFMPERPYFPTQLTAQEVVRSHALLCGYSLRAATTEATDKLTEVGLHSAQKAPLAHYSKGMLQRVGLAQALVADPDVVILDEPMSGLDPIGRHDVRKLLLRLKDAGKTLLFSTHILPDVEALAHTVALMAQGRIVRTLSGNDLGATQEGRYEVLAVPSPNTVLTGAPSMRQQARPGATAYEVDSLEDANRLVDALRQAGAQVVALRSVQSTLENWVLGSPRDMGREGKHAQH